MYTLGKFRVTWGIKHFSLNRPTGPIRSQSCKTRQSWVMQSHASLIRPLKLYTFECGFIFLNSLVRSSVLFGTEEMYNITEKRNERNWENGRSSDEEHFQSWNRYPSTHTFNVPPRYTIKRFKLNFFQYILHQKELSLLYRMLEAQQKQPSRGDWFSKCSEIKEMALS